MNSTVTVKYQTTVPKAVREALGIGVNDALDWTVEGGRATVVPVRDRFLRHRGTVRVGPGKIEADIEAARIAMAERRR